MWNEVSRDIHLTCVEKGFWPPNRNVGEIIALMHSELSEAWEAQLVNKMDDKLPHRNGHDVEIADALIRALDTAHFYGFDLDHNVGAEFFIPTIEGSDMPLPVVDIQTGHYILSLALEQNRKGKEPTQLYNFISWCLAYSAAKRIHIITIMHEKMDYNEKRPYLHGKKF